MKQKERNNRSLSTEEAAAMLGISPQTLNNWRSARVCYQPPYVKVGRRIVYKEGALRKYLRENTHDAVFTDGLEK